MEVNSLIITLDKNKNSVGYVINLQLYVYIGTYEFMGDDNTKLKSII